ncbi:chloride channel protein [Chryseolinea lacunae]|uniref:Chloride channel protein n=1 Tax=Chryseolinea lacunae TaxID=2801331 RepID=A0ABS1KXD3_9BACT|nr:chloride channel protein [Chryseolinea lacunae]MBL0742956.1 chloride channel protein [Chryseolinea lacunae]
MIHKIHTFVSKPILYLHDTLSQRQFFVLSSILVGLTSGLAAVVLKYFVHSIESFVTFYSNYYERFFLFAVFPLVGILLTVAYVRYFLKGKFKKGSAEIVYTIVKKSSTIESQQMYSHLVTSALTVGFGGSTGLESPMVSTGSAIGSNYGRMYNLSYKDRTILLACGSAAGIAAAFNSPIAGVLFAVEVLLTDVSAAAFIPLIISAACGALLSKIILKQGVVLSFSLQQPFNYHNVPHYVVLGVLAGLISLYYARMFTWVDVKMKSVANRWTRVIIGGVLLFLLLIFFPPLFGEGYESIKVLASLRPSELVNASLLQKFIHSDGAILLFLAALMFLKTIAAAITIGSGGNGGSFGPSLFVGAYMGYIFARVVNLMGFVHIPEVNFALVGMAGILSGVFYAPLTAIFLIAEITGGYGLMIPLMIVAALSITVVHYFEPLSMEAKKLGTMLDTTVENRDKFLLSKLDLSTLIETNFSTVKPDDTLPSLIKVISTSNRNTFPVVDEHNELQGLIHMDHVRSIIFSPEKHSGTLMKDLMTRPAAVIRTNENLHSVLKKFDDTNQWNLPVLDNKQYLGFVSKSNVLTKYRSELLKSV